MSRTCLLLSVPSLLLCACPAEVPAPLIEDLWTAQASPIDVLWVVDDSHSMDEAQQAVGAAFPSLAAVLESAGVDWQVGITTTDVVDPDRRGRLLDLGLASGRVLTPGTPSLAARFAAGIEAGTNGSDMERGLQAAWYAVSPPLATHENAGFLREGARLAIVVVSDEDDCSDEGAFPSPLPSQCAAQPDILVPVVEYLERFREIRADVAVYAMVETGIVEEFAGCGGTNPGSRYMHAARASAGDVVELCGDLGAHLSEIGQQLAGLRRAVVLSGTPEPGTLDVALLPADGSEAVPLAEDPARLDGWTWDVGSGTVRLWGEAVPALGETVRIRYRAGQGT